jgi:ABC-type nitrate/sulfonate/bicarbonate transport system permease component
MIADLPEIDAGTGGSMSRFMSALRVVAAFAFGIEAVVGYVLGTSSGLSEMHKTVLVAFLVGFPLVVLVALLPISARAIRAEDQICDTNPTPAE